MPLPVYDTQDAVPEAQREDYAEHDGKWRPKVEIELAVERKKRLTILGEKKEAERLRDEALAREAEARREREAQDNKVPEETLNRWRDEAAEARKPIEEERDRLKAENRQLKLTDRVKALALDAGVMPDRIKQAMKILNDRTDLGDEGGIVVKDEDGNVTTETITDFLGKSFKKESPWFYAGTGSSGSGAGSSSGNGQDTPAPAAPAKAALEAKRTQVAGTF